MKAYGISDDALESGKAWKVFESFDHGIESLFRVSWSVKAAVMHNMDMLPDGDADFLLNERLVVANLCQNAFDAVMTPHGACGVRVDIGELVYFTSSNLGFGWKRIDDGVLFWISHPAESFDPDSTLLASAIEEGWRVGDPPRWVRVTL